MTITEFLEARIAEDEAYAAQAHGRHYGWVDNWRAETMQGTKTESVIYAHAFRFSPERLLAECAAKRAIIAAHPIVEDVVEVSTRIKWGFACETCFSYGDMVEDNGYCDTLRSLAAVYADHPDYQQEWA